MDPCEDGLGDPPADAWLDMTLLPFPEFVRDFAHNTIW